MRRPAWVLAVLAYLGVSVLAWWHLVDGGIAHTITSNGYGDPAQQVWFVGWVPHALGNGLDPFVSTAMFAPRGINLMANSSILFPALVASPITEVFGPLVAFNVLLIASPVLSALACMFVARRYTDFALGAFFAGLFYGFSPFVMNDLGNGHVHMALLVFPPLIWALLDDLVVAQAGSPVRKGVLLGVVLVAQGLTSLEVLLIVTIAGGAGLLLLALSHPEEVKRRFRHVMTGLAATTVSFAIVFAWPMYILVAGPRRYHGSIFVSPESYVAWLTAFVWPRAGKGLQPLWAPYVGIGILVVVAVGLAVTRGRSLLIQMSLAVSLVALVFSMGRTAHLTPKLSTGIPLPDRLLTSLPLVENMLPVRFVIVVDLCMALAFAVALGAIKNMLASRRRNILATAAAGCVGVLALSSPALGAPFPYAVHRVSVPAVYRSRALSSLAPGSILLGYPVMNGFEADPMIWQAEEGFTYEMVAGYGFIPGPGRHPLGSLPTTTPVTNLFADAQLGLLGPVIPRREVRAVAADIRSLDVSDVVVIGSGKSVSHLVHILTTIFARAPRRIGRAELWTGLRSTRS